MLTQLVVFGSTQLRRTRSLRTRGERLSTTSSPTTSSRERGLGRQVELRGVSLHQPRLLLERCLGGVRPLRLQLVAPGGHGERRDQADSEVWGAARTQ